jgi:sporulation protein YlmC with PRC-barrel domain
MKTIIYCAAALVVLGVAAAPVLAQTQSTTSTTTNYIQTSKLIGSKVKASQGEEVGEIKDVVLDNNGCMAYTVVSTGGTATRTVGGGKTVAVPWSVYSMTSDPRVLTVRVERDRIYNAPVFEYSRINEYSTSGYINNVYSYYGVSAGAGVGVGATTGVSGTTTTTGTTATGAASTTATASPGAAASPVATGSPAMGASPAATAAASPAATGSPAATASPTRRATRGESPAATRGESPSGRTRATATPSSRRQTEGATEERTGESREETTGSPSGSTKKSHRHATEEGSTPESTASPKATPEQE